MQALRLVALCAVCHFAEAQQPKEHPIDARLRTCVQGGQVTTFAERVCLGEAKGLWETELAAVLAKLNSLLEPKAREKLKASQSAWLAMRKAEWELHEVIYPPERGTMWIPERLSLDLQLLKQRVAALTMLHDRESGASR